MCRPLGRDHSPHNALLSPQAAHRHVLGLGWSKRLVLWSDDDPSSAASTTSAFLANVGTRSAPVPSVPPCWLSEAAHRDDALCVALHPPATLASGGADGSVLLWELDSGALASAEGDLPAQAAYGSLRRRLQRPPPVGGGLGGDSPQHSDSLRAVEALVFLGALAPPLLPLVAACADGTLSIWETVTQARGDGGAPATLMHFHAGHTDDDALCSVATDGANSILVTADGGGTVKVWSLAPLREALSRTLAELGAAATGSATTPTTDATAPGGSPGGSPRISPLLRRSPSSSGLSASALERRRLSTRCSSSPGDSFSKLRKVRLRELHFWRVCDGGLAAMSLLEPHQSSSKLVAVAAVDGCASLWTLEGCCIGAFGQPSPWALANERSFASTMPQSPLPLEERLQRRAVRRLYQQRSREHWGVAKRATEPSRASDESAPTEGGSAPPTADGSLAAVRLPADMSGRPVDPAAAAGALTHARSVSAGAAAAEAARGGGGGQFVRSDADVFTSALEPRRSLPAPSGGGFGLRTPPKLRMQISDAWQKTLQASTLVASGDAAAAAAAAAEAAGAAKLDHELKRRGTSATWQPTVSQEALRTYLDRRYDGPAAAAAERRRERTTRAIPPRVALSTSAQVAAERQLEQLMRANAPPTASERFGDGGDAGTWDKVITRPVSDPPTEARPLELQSMRGEMKHLDTCIRLGHSGSKKHAAPRSPEPHGEAARRLSNRLHLAHRSAPPSPVL